MSSKEQKLKELKLRDAIKDYCKRTGHRAPISRREFLEAGILQFSASMVLPSIMTTLSSSFARAAECSEAAIGSTLAPFVTLNLRGGAGLMANVIPHKVGSQDLLTTYDAMGLGNQAAVAGNIIRTFKNNAPFPGNGVGNFLIGLQSTASAQTIANSVFVSVPCRSRDDSGANKYDISGLVQKAGLVGEKLPNLGSRDTVTGINQEFAFKAPTPPLRVNNYNDLLGAVGGGTQGAIGRLSKDQQIRMFKLIESLNTKQKRRLASLSGGGEPNEGCRVWFH